MFKNLFLTAGATDTPVEETPTVSDIPEVSDTPESSGSVSEFS